MSCGTIQKYHNATYDVWMCYCTDYMLWLLDVILIFLFHNIYSK